MRVKLNTADEYYIAHHCLKMDKEEISKEIDLSVKSFSDFYDESIVRAKEVEKEKTKKEQEKRREDGFTVMTQAEADQADEIVKQTINKEEKTPSHIWRPNE